MLHATLVAILASVSMTAAAPGISTMSDVIEYCKDKASNSGYDVKLCANTAFQCRGGKRTPQDVLEDCIWQRMIEPQTERRCEQDVFSDHLIECRESYKECYEENQHDRNQISIDSCVFTKTGLKADPSL